MITHPFHFFALERGLKEVALSICTFYATLLALGVGLN